MLSVAGKIAIPFAAPYCASKHALEAFSDALRVGVSPFGIRVAVIEAGPIETRFGDRARAGVARMLASPSPYSPFYKNAERAMDTDFQAGKLPPEAVARAIVDAIESDNPPDPLPNHADGSRPDSLEASPSRSALRLPDEESPEAPRPRLDDSSDRFKLTYSQTWSLLLIYRTQSGPTSPLSPSA